MATGSDRAGPSNYIEPVVQARVEGAMAVYGGGPAPVNQDIEVLDCDGCSMGSHQFWVEYGGKMESLIKLCQDHGLILKTKNCCCKIISSNTLRLVVFIYITYL